MAGVATMEISGEILVAMGQLLCGGHHAHHCHHGCEQAQHFPLAHHRLPLFSTGAPIGTEPLRY